MPIPDYQTIMLPLLEFASDQKPHTIHEAREHLSEHFKLTEEERKELLPSGTQCRFDNRVFWARQYMKEADLLQNPIRGSFQITKRGMDVLTQKPNGIDVNFLLQFDEFKDFRSRKGTRSSVSTAPKTGVTDQTSEEILEAAYTDLNENLISEILDQIKTCSPYFFERLVIDLLVKMGYGGSRRDAGQAIGRSGDEGIDGIIKEDKLGLDIIYVQAKRWEGNISRPEIQKFSGALQGQRAKKGIFITTSSFTKEALEFASKIDNKIVLVDGETLAQYMIDLDLGVTKVASYDLKKIDSDFFSEE